MSKIRRWLLMTAGLIAAVFPVAAALAAGGVRYRFTRWVSPPGGDFVSPADGTFAKNNVITVAANPAEGCTFDHWGGDLAGTQNPTHYQFDTPKYAVYLAAFFVGTTAGSSPPAPTSPPLAVSPQVIGYFPEWGVGHSPPYTVKNIATSGAAAGLTIINYAFAVPAPDARGRVVCQLVDPVAAYQQVYSADRSVDGAADGSSQALRGHFNQLKKLKARHPDLRVLVSIGGWLGSTWFSDAAATPAARQAFVASCMKLFVDGDLPEAGNAGGPGSAAGIFDGFDLDWEYPVSGGESGTHHRQGDGTHFTLLLEEFRRQFAAIGRKDGGADDLLLTMAGPATDALAQNFHLSEDHKFLDLVLIMTYDFHGSWEPSTGHHGNLCTSPDDPATATLRTSLDRTVKLYRDQFGVPAAKLVPGGAFYARGWKGVRATNNGLYQRASGAAPGRYDASEQYYRDLPLNDKGEGTHGYARYWDARAKAPWLFNPSTGIFWSYDDGISLALKGAYARYHRLGGLMFWELSGDDDPGHLFQALRKTLSADPPSSDPCGG